MPVSRAGRRRLAALTLVVGVALAGGHAEAVCPLDPVDGKPAAVQWTLAVVGITDGDFQQRRMRFSRAGPRRGAYEIEKAAILPMGGTSEERAKVNTTALQDHLLDIRDILDRKRTGAPADRRLLVDRMRELALLASERAVEPKRDEGRGIRRKEDVTIPDLAPGFCREDDHIGKSLGRNVFYCDENFTSAGMYGLAEAATALHRHGGDRARSDARLIADRIGQVDRFYLATQWKKVDPRYPAVLLYLREGVDKAMHDNGVAEYGLFLLALANYHRTSGWGDADPAALEDRVADLWIHFLSTAEPFSAGSDVYCRWQYAARETSRLEDPNHGSVLLRFMLALREHAPLAGNAKLAHLDRHIGAFAAAFFEQGFTGDPQIADMTDPRRYQMKAAFEFGITPCARLDKNGKRNVNCVPPRVLCHRNLDAFRLSRRHLRSICDPGIVPGDDRPIDGWEEVAPKDSRFESGNYYGP